MEALNRNTGEKQESQGYSTQYVRFKSNNGGEAMEKSVQTTLTFLSRHIAHSSFSIVSEKSMITIIEWL